MRERRAFGRHAVQAEAGNAGSAAGSLDPEPVVAELLRFAPVLVDG